MVATGMVFPPNEAVENAVHKKRKRKSSYSSFVSTTTPFSSRYATSPFLIFCNANMSCPINLAHFHVPPDLELDPINQFLSKLCTLPLSKKILLVRMSHRKLLLLQFIHQGERLE
jgi:hypothetical protein